MIKFEVILFPPTYVQFNASKIYEVLFRNKLPLQECSNDNCGNSRCEKEHSTVDREGISLYLSRNGPNPV